MKERKEVPTSIRTKFQAVKDKQTTYAKDIYIHTQIYIVLFSFVSSSSFTFPCKHQYVRFGFIRHARGSQLQASLEVAARVTGVCGKRGDTASQPSFSLHSYNITAVAEQQPNTEQE